MTKPRKNHPNPALVYYYYSKLANVADRMVLSKKKPEEVGKN
jgi:hypothetical protein